MREGAAELPKEASGCQPASGFQLPGGAGANTELTEATEVNSKTDGILRESGLRPPTTVLVPLAARFEVCTARVQPSHVRQDFWDQTGVIERPCAIFDFSSFSSVTSVFAPAFALAGSCKLAAQKLLALSWNL